VRTVAPRQVVHYLHLAQAALTGGDPVVRLEPGNARVTAEQVRAWCGRPETQVTVTPVLDPDACTWSSGDRVTPAIAEKVAVRGTRPVSSPGAPARPADADPTSTTIPATTTTPTPAPRAAPPVRATSRPYVVGTTG
jgi:hypothetical protein